MSYPFFYGGYGYGYYPEPWQTSWVPKHFPEHHYPLEHTRHSISHALHEFGHELAGPTPSHGMISPRVDCRESRSNYYFDIEIPGVANTEHLTLRWIASRTLLVKAIVKRKPTPEEDEVENTKKEAATGDASGKKEDHAEQKVFLTMSERRIGVYGRALGFSVDVDHEKTIAKLEAGVLRLTVPKLAEDQKVNKTVDVHKDDGPSADVTSSGGVSVAER